jgi:hypothetical protein
MTRGSSKAVELLNEPLYNKLFNPHIQPLEEVKLIYRIYFGLLNKRDITSIKDSNEFWEVACSYITYEGKGKTGNLIAESVKQFDFTDANIHRLARKIDKNINKISPAYFSKICGTTGLIIFLIKDALEYAGILIQDKKNIPARLVRNIQYQLDLGEQKVRRLENILLMIKA